MKHDPAVYRAVSQSLDALFKKHGDKAATCINRYMRIRTETRSKERRIATLQAELDELQTVAPAKRSGEA